MDRFLYSFANTRGARAAIAAKPFDMQANFRIMPATYPIF
jgi:hypothetical protein